jgi:APA family basic amino acid/polyamine antiporter
MGIIISAGLMASLPRDTWLRLIIWLVIGMVIYFGYGRHHSRVQVATSNSLLSPATEAGVRTQESGVSKT